MVPSFDQADTNRDGVVSRQEFQNAAGATSHLGKLAVSWVKRLSNDVSFNDVGVK